jgi:hypothetical protein
MLEKGKLVRISRDELDIYLQGLLCDVDRLSLENVANYCFSRDAAAVFEFVNLMNGNHRCIGYMAVFDDEKLLKQNIGSFDHIEQSMYLGSFAVEDIDELEDKELLSAIKKRAFHLAFWEEEKDCAILVLR